MRDTTKRDMAMLVDSKLSEAKQQVSELKHRLKTAESNMNHYEELANDLKGLACTECKGFGKVRVFHAQDESRIETCEKCNGTGMAEKS